MAEWYVKDLSRITEVSVQTLHHYDRIGLLKPSVRLSNGYRLYSEKDLLKLQQIIALKFFGFELSQIKKFLEHDVNVWEHLATQSKALEEKAKGLLDASHVLKEIISTCDQDKSIPWETIIKSIGVYRMTEKLENSWAAKALNHEELKEYANFDQTLKKRFTESEKQSFETKWADLIQELNANLDKDPKSDYGIAMGKRCMEWVNRFYGKEFFSLRNAIWEKGFKAGHGAGEHGLSPKAVTWLDTAIDAYYHSRGMSILVQAQARPNDKKLVELWEELITDMCGEDQQRRKAVFEIVMQDKSFTQEAKNWVKKVMQ